MGIEVVDLNQDLLEIKFFLKPLRVVLDLVNALLEFGFLLELGAYFLLADNYWSDSRQIAAQTAEDFR